MTYKQIYMNPEKDGVIQTLLNAFEANKDQLKTTDPQLYYALLDFKDSQKEEPSLNYTVEVKRGEWIPMFNKPKPYEMCSECKAEYPDTHNYCPYCGAEMSNKY